MDKKLIYILVIFLLVSIIFLLYIGQQPPAPPPSQTLHSVKNLNLSINPGITEEILSFYEWNTSSSKLFSGGKNGWHLLTNKGDLGVYVYSEQVEQEYNWIKNNTLFNFSEPNIYYGRGSDPSGMIAGWLSKFNQYCKPYHVIKGWTREAEPLPISILRNYNCTMNGNITFISLDIPDSFILSQEFVNRSSIDYVDVRPDMLILSFPDKELIEYKEDYDGYSSHINNSLKESSIVEKKNLGDGFYWIDNTSFDYGEIPSLSSKSMWYCSDKNLTIEIKRYGGALLSYDEVKNLSSLLGCTS
jgi:hypothetical protein